MHGSLVFDFNLLPLRLVLDHVGYGWLYFINMRFGSSGVPHADAGCLAISITFRSGAPAIPLMPRLYLIY